jgi:hypothetical protein
MELPARAKGDFRRILELDMERATPFRAAEVLTAHYASPGAAPCSFSARLSGSMVLRFTMMCWTRH